MKKKPIYLFVCIENACRSQMAEGLFNSLTDKAIAKSVGTSPSASINPMALEVMKERSIDISSQEITKLTPELMGKAYRVITMGCIDNCPFTPAEKTIKWDIPDPKGKSKEFFIKVRDQIESNVKDLLKKEKLIQ